MSLREETDRRLVAVFTILPYALLAVGTTLTLIQQTTTVHIAAVLGLTLAITVWMLVFDTHPRWHRRRSLLTLYYAGLTVASAGLVVLAPSYGIFAFIGYVHAFERLRGVVRQAGAVATSMIMAVSYLGGAHNITGGEWWEWAAISLVSSVLSVSCFALLDLVDRRGREQERALTESHEANARLEAALEENAGLHAQLLVQAREAGVLDERQRMAGEIHDTLAQGLAGILTQLQAVERKLDEPLRRHVTNAMNLARESLAEARRTVHAVEPAMLAEARLPEAIGELARNWAELHDVETVLTTDGAPRPMHTDVEVTLLRAAQEALANVAKHADATRVGLTLSYLEDKVVLDVRDDGAGFDPGAKRAGGSGPGGSGPGGFGLVGMRQRVQRLAGRLDVESEPGAGTAISASVPAIPVGGER